MSSIMLALSDEDRGQAMSLIQTGSNILEKDIVANTPMHVVAELGFLTIATELIKYATARNILDSCVNARNSSAEYPLHHSSERGFLEVSTQLLKNGANVNVTDRKGNTPLHRACSGGLLRTVKLLLSYDADVHVQNENGEFPLHLAARGLTSTLDNFKLSAAEGEANHYDVAVTLIKSGAKLHVKDKLGNTALACATRPHELGLKLVRAASSNLPTEDKTDFYEKIPTFTRKGPVRDPGIPSLNSRKNPY